MADEKKKEVLKRTAKAKELNRSMRTTSVDIASELAALKRAVDVLSAKVEALEKHK